MSTEMTAAARTGYDGNPNEWIATSPLWYAHSLGQWLNRLGYSPPVGVRMGRGHSVRANGMRFDFRGEPMKIQRVE